MTYEGIGFSLSSFPGGSDGKKKKNLPAMQETQVQSLGGKDTTEGLTLSLSDCELYASREYVHILKIL